MTKDELDGLETEAEQAKKFGGKYAPHEYGKDGRRAPVEVHASKVLWLVRRVKDLESMNRALREEEMSLKAEEVLALLKESVGGRKSGFEDFDTHWADNGVGRCADVLSDHGGGECYLSVTAINRALAKSGVELVSLFGEDGVLRDFTLVRRAHV